MTRQMREANPFDNSMETGGTTDKYETSSETAELHESNLTHSSHPVRYSLPMVHSHNRVRKIPNLNESNVSSIMQVSFAHIPDSGPKLRSNSAFQGDSYQLDLEQLRGERAYLKTEPDDILPEAHNYRTSNFGQTYSPNRNYDDKSLMMFLQQHQKCPSVDLSREFQQNRTDQREVNRDLFGARGGYFPEIPQTHPGEVTEFQTELNYASNRFNGANISPVRGHQSMDGRGRIKMRPITSPYSPKISKLGHSRKKSGYDGDIEGVHTLPSSHAVTLTSQQFLKGMNPNQFKMIDEIPHEENASTARGFGVLSRTKELSKDTRHPFTIDEQLDLKDEESDELLDEGLMSNREHHNELGDFRRHSRQFSTKETHNGSVPSERGQLLGTQTSLPSSTRNASNPRFIQKIGAGYQVPPLPLPPSSTPTELNSMGYITPQTAMLNRERMWNSSVKDVSTVYKGHHKYSSSSVPPSQLSALPSQNYTKSSYYRSQTPNMTTSARKYYSQRPSIMIPNLLYQSNTSGLNSSRYSDIQRKKEEIQNEVQKIVKNRRFSNRNSILTGLNKYSSVEIDERASMLRQSKNSLREERRKRLSMEIPTESAYEGTNSLPPSCTSQMILENKIELPPTQLQRVSFELMRQRTEKLKQELLSQFETNEKRSLNTSFSVVRSVRLANSPPFARGLGHTPISQPQSTTNSQAPGPCTINQAIQKTIDATKDNSSLIVSKVDGYKKEVAKIREDLNDTVIRNIELQQKSSFSCQKQSEQNAKITRIEMKLRARTQELNEIQNSALLFLENVRKGQTELTIQAQNYKHKSESRILCLIQRQIQLQKDLENRTQELNSLRSDLNQSYQHQKDSEEEMGKLQQKLALVEPKLEKTLEDSKELRAELKRIQQTEKDLLLRENQIKVAEKNYYKSIASSTLQELRKFDQRQINILQQISGKENQLSEPGVSPGRPVMNKMRGENRNEYLKALRQKEEVIHELKEFEKKKAKQQELQNQSEGEQKELQNLRLLLKERKKNAELASENANMSKWAFMIFGVIIGMVLMTLCVRIL